MKNASEASAHKQVKQKLSPYARMAYRALCEAQQSAIEEDKRYGLKPALGRPRKQG